MQKIIGKFTSAVIYSDTAEDYAKAQTKMICDSAAAAGSIIKVMPDVHPGKIGPIGLTMTFTDKVMPGLVGTDIGCGVSYMKIRKTNIEFQKLDKVIRERIPTGSSIRKEAHRFSADFDFKELICRKHINEEKAVRSLGTLGSGNHFIEVDVDGKGSQYVFVHTGSRSLGKMVFDFYMKRGSEDLKKNGVYVPYEMTYLEGELMADYLHDVSILQGYAMLNREIILSEIAKGMKFKEAGYRESFHNYVDEQKILRKGAVSAYEGEDVIIPINMRDGIILGTGKGNAEWNYSAPHGAGRVVKKSEVKERFTAADFRKEMKGIHFSMLDKATLSEAPFAYRGLKEIREAIRDTVEIKEILKPVYNYRAGEEVKENGKV